MDLQSRNVIDRYKSWSTELVRDDLATNAFPFAVLMENFVGDFNFGTVIRSANAFNAKAVYYVGNRKYDKRGAVGTYNYSYVHHLPDYQALENLKSGYEFVALENTVSTAVSIYDVKYERPPLFILGEEGIGVTDRTMSMVDRCVFIPQYGSVRSLNAAVAGSIAMNDFVAKYRISPFN